MLKYTVQQADRDLVENAHRFPAGILPVQMKRMSLFGRSIRDSYMFGSDHKTPSLDSQGKGETGSMRHAVQQSTKLLIVEDEAIVALDIRMTLTRLGYEVIGTAASGREAIQCIQTLKPDLVLMDIRLREDMDGIQVAEYMRANLNIPVIFLTGQADAVTLERAQAVGPSAYLLKPFSQFDLHSAIITALKHDGPQQ